MNPAPLAKRLSNRIRAYFAESKRRRAVLGISGGVDSALVAALAARALGAKNITGLIMPSKATKPSDVADAKLLAKKLGIKTRTISITPLVKAFENSLASAGIALSKVGSGNIAARARMALLYAIANESDALVLGTGDRSELLLGYFTKYGDGGCDLLPIGSLYKTGVRELARGLKLPARIISKPSSPGLWAGHTAEGELGASYSEVDAALKSLAKGKKPTGKIAKLVLPRIKNSEHKRKTPPIL